MKTITTLVLAMAAAAGLMAAADKPNFSGEYTMDAAKSDFGPAPPPSTMTRKVTHSDPAMTVVEARDDQSTTVKYSTDGKETTNELMGAPTKSTAKWDGNALLVVTKADFQGTEITINSKWTLSPDGKVLTDTWHLVTPQGEFDMTYVLNKK